MRVVTCTFTRRLVPSEAYLGLIIFPVMMVCIVGHIYIGTNQVFCVFFLTSHILLLLVM